MRFPYIVASQSRFSLGPHPSWSALREEDIALVRVAATAGTRSVPLGSSQLCPAAWHIYFSLNPGWRSR